jgi:acyl-CoA synthetase (NDP forming)
MSIENLDKIFHPKFIAVVGASEREGSIGAALMRNLLKGGFTGDLYPINLRRKKVMDIRAYPSVSDLKTPVDLALISTPITTAPQIVKECAEAGIGGVVIISAGGKEIGAAGKNVEAAIRKEASRNGLRVIGPNCLGIVSSRSRLNASFASHMPLPGKMAFISQSGAICTAILDLSIREHFGFSYFISLGSMLGDATPELFRKVVQICLDAKETNGILIMAAPQALTDSTKIAAALVDLLQKNSFPVFTCWLGDADMENGRKIFNQAGIPTFDTPERAVRAFMDLHHYTQNIEMLQEIPVKLPAKLDFDRETAHAVIQQGLLNESRFLSEGAWH